MKNNPLYTFNLTRTEWVNLIHERIFDERDRRLLVLRYLDGHTLQEVAEEIGLSVEQTKRRNKAALGFLLSAAKRL